MLQGKLGDSIDVLDPVDMRQASSLLGTKQLEARRKRLPSS
jgi:hypothetical protein